MTLPTLVVKSILSGSPYPELTGNCFISSSSGYTSRIDFEGKGWFGTGKKNTLGAVLYRTGDEKHPIYEVTGQWNGSLTFHDCIAKKDLETVEIETLDTTYISTAPISKQDPWESRRAWNGVIEGITKQDMKKTSTEKSRIEEAQRDLRRIEKENGVLWPRLFFEREGTDHVAIELLDTIGETLHVDRTNGVWKFIGPGAAAKIQKPFHAGLEPTGQVEHT